MVAHTAHKAVNRLLAQAVQILRLEFPLQTRVCVPSPVQEE